MFQPAKYIAAGALLTLSSVSYADCTMPTMPSIPEGASATLEEMVAGQKAVKAFQAETLAYRNCVDSTLQELKSAAVGGDEAAAQKFEQATTDYNASVAKEEELANQFNAEIRAYKAANPG